jgi:hypothetical protein
MDISNTSAAQIAQTLAVGGTVGTTVYSDLSNMYCATYDNFEQPDNTIAAATGAAAPIIDGKPDDRRWIEELAAGCLGANDDVPSPPPPSSGPQPQQAPESTPATISPTGHAAAASMAAEGDAAADEDEDGDSSSDGSSSGSDSSSDEDEPDAASDRAESPLADYEPATPPPPPQVAVVASAPGSPRKQTPPRSASSPRTPPAQPSPPRKTSPPRSTTERPIARARKPSPPKHEFGFNDLQIRIIDDGALEAAATKTDPQQQQHQPQLQESPQAKLLRSVAAQQQAVENQLRNERPPVPVAVPVVPANASRSSNSRKRAAPPAPITVTMLQFVRMLNDTFINIRFSPDGDHKINMSAIKRELEQYDAETFDVYVPTRPVPDKEPPRVANSLLNLCYNLLMFQLEADGCIMAFPRDGFKYLLAYYRPFLTAANFSGTNSVRPNARSGKSNAILANGLSVSEFVKSPHHLATCIARADKNNLECLKLVVSLGLQINADVFTPYLWHEFEHPRYEADSVAKVRRNHACIPITNNSRLAILLVTRDVVLMYDAASTCFAPVLLNVDRKIPYSIRRKLDHSDHLVLEVLLGTKLRIVDLLDAYIYPGGKEPRPCVDPLPDSYVGRIEVIAKLIDTVPVVTPTSASESELAAQGGYLQKPMKGPPTVGFQYHRMHHTVAIVGTFQTDALYAYQAGPKLLEVNASRTPITGGTSMLITSRAQTAKRFRQEDRARIPTTIMMLGEEYTLTGDIPPDARIFEEVIVADLTENKVPVLSDRPVWDVAEVRPPPKAKDHSEILNVVAKNARDPSFRLQVMEMLKISAAAAMSPPQME